MSEKIIEKVGITLQVPCIGYEKTITLTVIEKNIIKPYSDLAYYIIKWGVTKEEADYIILDKDGFIDNRKLTEGKNKLKQISENFECLLKISKNDTTIELRIQEYYETERGIFFLDKITYEDSFDSDYKMYKESINKSASISILSREEFKKKQEGIDIFYEKMWDGKFAITLFPDIAGSVGKTTNGLVQIIINKSFLDIIERREALQEMSAYFAHEAYGHLLFKILGKNPFHGHKRSITENMLDNNKELEIQIYNRENEARKHFNQHIDTYTPFL